jgi:hypothetical protein
MAVTAETATGPDISGKPERGRTANAGHAASAMNATEAATVWATELPRTGCGKAATNIVPTPPPTRSTRPPVGAIRSPSPVTTYEAPSANKALVMIQRSVAPCAASELIVSRTGS